jgi:hypothetical protein
MCLHATSRKLCWLRFEQGLDDSVARSEVRSWKESLLAVAKGGERQRDPG